MAKTFIISGGGTGGHIFPAVSIANALKKRHPNATIHFVGALGKMEMTKVPASGYPITGVPIAGINRKKPWKSPLDAVAQRASQRHGMQFFPLIFFAFQYHILRDPIEDEAGVGMLLTFPIQPEELNCVV